MQVLGHNTTPQEFRQRRKSKRFADWVRGEALPFMLKVICVAEQVPGLSGPEKLDYAANLLNKYIDVPYCPEWIEDYLFRASLTILVEVGNKLFGKKAWYKEFMDRADLDSVKLDDLAKVRLPKGTL